VVPAARSGSLNFRQYQSFALRRQEVGVASSPRELA
jgi:hypothetical protein